MVALNSPNVDRRPDDSQLSERGLHRRQRERLGIMQRGLRRLEHQVAQQDIATGINHEDDPVDFSTQRGVMFWPEDRKERQFQWQDDETEFTGWYEAASLYASRMRRVAVVRRKLPASRRAGAVAAQHSR